VLEDVRANLLQKAQSEGFRSFIDAATLACVVVLRKVYFLEELPESFERWAKEYSQKLDQIRRSILAAAY
jgi:hypothetical protein